MYSASQLENILFLDIETASSAAEFSGLPERLKELWEKRTAIHNRREGSELSPEEMYLAKAGMEAEFGKVVCISCGIIQFPEGKPRIRMKSFYGEDEVKLLNEFAAMLEKFASDPGKNLAAHNGKGFDYPYLSRRFVINQMEIPSLLQIQGKKPWEIGLIDTMELWKFGDHRSYASLDLLTAVMDVPTPKDDMDGSQVGTVFWNEKDYERIKIYCEKDVLATAQVVLRFCRMPLIAAEDVISV